MRTIRLDLDALVVDSFSPDGEAGKLTGTVQGHGAAFAAPDIPTLETGHHGCYACPATVLRTCVDCA
jgi:hypothetical protein